MIKVVKKVRDAKKDIKKAMPFVIIALIMWGVLELLYAYHDINFMDIIRSIPGFYESFKTFFENISSRDFLAIFVFFSLTSIFIFPMPLDLIALGFLKETLYPHKMLLTIYFGILIGQHINYILGKFFGKKFMKYVKKKNRDWIEKTLFKYESYALFVFNLFPLPYTLMNFIVGVSQFKYLRWLKFVSLSLLLKLILIVVFLV